MNTKLRKELKEGFQAPVPQKKEEFFATIQTSSISNFEFLCLQVVYIRKCIWVFSALSSIVFLISAEYFEKDTLWCISAFTPLLALSIITESGRSAFYGMAELELSTRFSLKSVVLARLGILGAANFILLCMFIPFAYMNSNTTVLQTGIYILCPYLLTTFLGLWTVRKVHGKEAIYFCTAIALCISVGNIVFYQWLPMLYENYNVIWWIIAFILLCISTAKECCQTIKQTEELAWN